MEAHGSNPQAARSLGNETLIHRKDFGIVPGLVWAFRIHADGTADSLPIDQSIADRHDGWLWLHLDLADERAAHWLAGVELPVAAVAMLLSRDRHQQINCSGSCIYGIFADLMRHIGGASDEIGHLRFIMTERLLISGRHHALTAVESARLAIEAGQHRLASVAELLELIVEHVAEGVDAIVDDLATQLDRIEEDLAHRSKNFDRLTLAGVRRTSVRLHRQLSGLCAVFHRLERRGTDDMKPQLRLAAAKLAQRVDALDHEVLELRERGHRLQEELSVVMAEAANRHLYILTTLTTLFLPPTLVTGVLGMNTKGLPLSDVDGGFLWAVAIIVASSLAAYLIMRRIGVFKF